MTNLITLTIPNDDHIALRAFGKALEEMALARGAEPMEETLVRARVGEKEIEYLTHDAVAARLRIATETLQQAAPHMMDEPEVDTTAQQVESLAAPMGDDEEEAPPTTDSTGTPWDERIHSTSKALNADGTWRLRRKPKDMDEAEWATFVEGIKVCYEVDNSPVQQAEQPFTCEQQPINLDHVSIDPVHETVESTVEPPITPPVVVAPPVPEVAEWDFPRLMTFLTERHGKIDVATVNTLLAQDGMSSVQELNAHPDKIGPFVARVKAHLGE